MLGTDFLQPKVSAIPVYMPVTLDVAKGFKYGTDAQFQQFGRQLQNAAQSFDKMPLTLCNGKLTFYKSHHILRSLWVAQSIGPYTVRRLSSICSNRKVVKTSKLLEK